MRILKYLPTILLFTACHSDKQTSLTENDSIPSKLLDTTKNIASKPPTTVTFDTTGFDNHFYFARTYRLELNKVIIFDGWDNAVVNFEPAKCSYSEQDNTIYINDEEVPMVFSDASVVKKHMSDDDVALRTIYKVDENLTNVFFTMVNPKNKEMYLQKKVDADMCKRVQEMFGGHVFKLLSEFRRTRNYEIESALKQIRNYETNELASNYYSDNDKAKLSNNKALIEVFLKKLGSLESLYETITQNGEQNSFGKPSYCYKLSKTIKTYRDYYDEFPSLIIY